jgi:hypothetical protein
MAKGRVTLQGRRGLAVLFALFGLFVIAGPTPSAHAEFEIVPGSFTARMLNAEGQPENRAGSHPDRLEIGFALNLDGTTPRDLVFELPAGLAGNNGAVQECSRVLFEAGEECPPESQTGTLRFVVDGGGNVDLPVFQLEPGPGEFISFASKTALEAPLKTELRPDDFGITLRADELPKQALTEGHVELWGVPADHQAGTPIPRRPMLTVPTQCGPLVFSFHTRSWLEGAPWLSASSDAGPLEGCAELSFTPSLSVRFGTPVSDSPTGMQIELTTPEEVEESEQADANVQGVTVELPAGLTISPGGAAGLASCSDAQLGLGSSEDAHCPAGSKVGTVELVSPALSDPLTGGVYLGEERPSERLRLFVVAPGPGVVVKFVGAMNVDPVTGRFSATLSGLPRLAFSHLRLSFDGGPKALLASPLACGPATAVGRFVPYGGGLAVESRSTATVAARIPGTPCPGPLPFAPGLKMHSSQHGTGRATALSVSLLRKDGEQLPRRFTLKLPAGLSAAFGSIGACSDAGVAAAACPASSRIGAVRAVAGSGLSTVALQGDAYVTGPYKRAPLGLLLQLHAALGPFQLGTVSFRASGTIDGRTGRVSVSTDSLPDTVEGIQVRFQSIELSMDRQGLIRNPTSCKPATVDATIEANGGAVATVSSPLPLSGCHHLGFRPGFRMALEGGRKLRRHDHPGLRISAQLRKGDTGLRALKFALPKVLGFNAGGLKAICSRPDIALSACPAEAQVGTAVARTSLLDEPLKGGIYVVQPKDNGPPDLGISLGAMGFKVGLTGHTESRHGRFVTKLTGLPDMPFSNFTMRLNGGSEGALSLGASICKEGRPRKLASALVATGQDGSERNLRVPTQTNARCR